MPSNSHIHRSVEQVASGTLYLVSTPIGNLADVTLRALATLQAVDLIAAEDTRHSGRFLKIHDIRRPLISYHDHNARRRAPELVARLRAGDSVALISDAGTPALSDPGYLLVRAVIAADLPVVPIPGPAAALAALCASGLPTDAFFFAGFPPRKTAQRRRYLESLAHLPCTLIFYESPRRVTALLEVAQRVFGNRQAVLARELTKRYEEFLRGSISDLISRSADHEPLRGECTLLMAGARGGTDGEVEIEENLRLELQDSEARLSEVTRRLARRHDISRRRVYELALQIRAGLPNADPTPEGSSGLPDG